MFGIRGHALQVSCACGQVEWNASGAPIAVVACYCDDCQAGARLIEARPHAPAVLGPDGASEYVLYRKDRLKCLKGHELLQDVRIREKSPTKRVVAGCCNSAMYLDFSKGHWLSVYRDRLVGAAPPLQMRIQTRFRHADAAVPDRVPDHPGFPLKLLSKVVLARVAMLLPA